MRPRTTVLLASAAAATTVLIIASSTAGSGAHPPDRPTSPLAGPHAVHEALPVPSPAPAPDDPFSALQARAKQATADAQKHGADISFTLLDRQTDQVVSSGDNAAFPIASVAKLFIADDLLTKVAQGQARLSPDQQHGLDVMLRASDDFPADDFWSSGGGNAIISRVASRYKLSGTKPPYDGNWWNTTSTTSDLVRYYDMLLDGSGGLPPPQTNIMLGDLAASTPVGVDGYPQRFGIPDGLFAEPVAVKQGWMCCWDFNNQVHLSTGVVGPDRRYVIAVAAMQPVDEAAARNTLTEALKTMFPGGRI